jgi:GNAT superfamily N-acetyltransferase
VITVAKIRSGDVDLVNDHVREKLERHKARLRAQDEGQALYLVAWSGDIPVGHGLLKLPPHVGVHSRAYGIPEVEDLFVAHARRSSGVGTRLLQECEEAARRQGFRRIGLGVGVENARARRLYERNGYVDGGFAPYWDEGSHETCVYLVKEL